MLKSMRWLVALALLGCQTQPSVSSTPLDAVDDSTLTVESVDNSTAHSELTQSASDETTPLWASDLSDSDWMSTWEPRSDKSWGLDNLEVRSDSAFDQVLRVYYPAGSASPSVSRQNEVPLGGAQFYADLFTSPRNQLRLSYHVKFAEEFDFVKGGKLPGLFGGTGASGGSTPDGADGFSVRLMWRRDGQGEVYAYLPTSESYGTSIERGAWQFQPGVWYKLEQEIVLNTPEEADGEIRLWVNDTLVIEQKEVIFRTVDSLQIDGIFFSTFFGGGDPSWATPQDTYIEFAKFSVTAVE